MVLIQRDGLISSHGKVFSNKIILCRYGLYNRILKGLIDNNKKAPDNVWSFFNGQRWIRTIEASCSRFTVCPLWPLGNLPMWSTLVQYSTLFTLWQVFYHVTVMLLFTPNSVTSNDYSPFKVPLRGRGCNHFMINTMAHSLTAQCQACVWTVTLLFHFLLKPDKLSPPK